MKGIEKMLLTWELEVYLKIANFLGISPWRTRGGALFWLSKLYLVTYCPFFIYAILSNIVVEYGDMMDYGDSISDALLDCLSNQCGKAFVLCVYWKSIFNGANWFSLLNRVSDKAHAYPQKKLFAFVKILLTHSLLFSTFFLIRHLWFGTGENHMEAVVYLSYIDALLMTYYIFVFVALACALTNLLRHRYDRLKLEIEETFSVNRFQVTNRCLKRIRNVKHHYTELYRAVADFNLLFGLPITIVLFSAFVVLLNSFNWSLNYLPSIEEQEKVRLTLASAVFFVCYLGPCRLWCPTLYS
ncbi:hypothetical protein JTB14_032748 [Gonioctena quinquepunctata]|nr:hypothetical protein JTB14_032748 [Gonioctena quinquepunctata]